VSSKEILPVGGIRWAAIKPPNRWRYPWVTNVILIAGGARRRPTLSGGQGSHGPTLFPGWDGTREPLHADDELPPPHSAGRSASEARRTIADVVRLTVSIRDGLGIAWRKARVRGGWCPPTLRSRWSTNDIWSLTASDQRLVPLWETTCCSRFNELATVARTDARGSSL